METSERGGRTRFFFFQNPKPRQKRDKKILWKCARTHFAFIKRSKLAGKMDRRRAFPEPRVQINDGNNDSLQDFNEKKREHCSSGVRDPVFGVWKRNVDVRWALIYTWEGRSEQVKPNRKERHSGAKLTKVSPQKEESERGGLGLVWAEEGKPSWSMAVFSQPFFFILSPLLQIFRISINRNIFCNLMVVSPFL